MNRSQHKIFSNALISSLPLAVVLAATLAGCVTGVDPAQKYAHIPGEGVSIYAAGDIADCRHLKAADTGAAQTARLIMAELAKKPAAVVLSLGDNTYPAGLPSEFADCYEPTWGQFKARTYPSPGNHDYYTPAGSGYYGYFGDAAGPARRGYYSVDIGAWHVISLNSNLRLTEFAAQLAWLKADLDQHKTRCTLAYWHHPVYSSGGHGDYDFMLAAWQALVAADADVVLVAHDHDYERFAPQDGNGQRDDARGIRQFVVGTGGAALTSFRFRKSNSETGDNSTDGMLSLTLKETGYEWKFLPVTPGGFTDRGATLCH